MSRPRRSFANTSVVVTGAAGFLGRHLMRALHELDAHVLGIDTVDLTSLAWSRARDGRSEFLRGDVTDRVFLAGAFAGWTGRGHPETWHVLHMAGCNDAQRSSDAPVEAARVNVVGTVAVLEACRSVPVKSIVVPSSSYVYAQDAAVQDNPLGEEHALACATIYAASKQSVEHFAQAFSCESGLPVVVARLFNVFGPGQPDVSVIPSILRQMLSRDRIAVGNVHAVRDFVYVEDVVDALLALSQTPRAMGTVLNVGSGMGHSVQQVIDLATSITGFEGVVEVVGSRVRSRDAQAVVADLRRIRQLTDWQPQYGLKAGLEAYVAYLQQPERNGHGGAGN
jgi:UDP-glucose 4-epimerase